jgi:dienelactone hydrolase
MDLQRVHDVKAPDGHAIPAFLMTPEVPCGAALVLHPYGGAKEHMLGLAESLAARRVAALIPDLCGHGENMTAIAAAIMREEMEAAIRYLRRFGAVAATGVSLGGRLALMSSADCMVAISPAVVTEISAQGKWMFEHFPSPAVREPYSGYVTELLDVLGPVAPHDRPCLLLYAERDIPMILQGAKGLKADLAESELRYVTRDLRPDVQHENGLIRYLPRWFNHGDLKFNLEAVQTTAAWIAEQIAAPRALGSRA